jgi:hypothetical protein
VSEHGREVAANRRAVVRFQVYLDLNLEQQELVALALDTGSAYQWQDKHASKFLLQVADLPPVEKDRLCKMITREIAQHKQSDNRRLRLCSPSLG